MHNLRQVDAETLSLLVYATLPVFGFGARPKKR
jgi:hypothetical protein